MFISCEHQQGVNYNIIIVDVVKIDTKCDGVKLCVL